MLNNFFKYLTVSKTEESWGLYVTTVGYSKVEPNQNYPNESHPDSHKLTWNRGRILNDYYIIFITRGKGVFEAENLQPTEVSAGQCFFLFPGVWHRYKPDVKSGWEEYWVGFNGYYIQQLMKNLNFNPARPFVDIKSNKEILVLLHRIFDQVKAASVGYHQQIAGITLQILGVLNTISRFKAYDNDPVGRLIAKAEFILQESYETQVDVEELASQLPMGYSAFRKAFKRITGVSPNQYHLNLRLSRARDLLINTNLNISEITNQTGFESVYYFSKLFKKKNGLSPVAFRKQESII
ncbi:helix-turn-helix domain-containing protein [Spirosoma foliorum]|uniref:AraC family transcriptional regulator n=1 Tax=Spirosoma foliorum TaxID=2710596 RepID=A0A7G5H120_9BACT|nr:AraC family transcriptional regulator [Spirosoma foliorum]QMW04812.1 AraC family transcriptional regulator [Spirosoma foliorum]